MPKVTDATPSVFDKPIFVPAKVILSPLTWTISKVNTVFRAFLGWSVRIGVFSFGEWQRSWVKHKIIEIYSGGLWALFSSSRWSSERLEKGFEVLVNCGGIRETTLSKDGTKIDSMRIRYQDFKAKIHQHGGKIVPSFPIGAIVKVGEVTQCQQMRKTPSEFVDIILPNEGGAEWKAFYQNTLQHLKLEKATVKLEDGNVVEGFILNHWDEKVHSRPKEGQCVIRCCSPTESYPIGKRDIMRFVALGMDVICFDYRGTWKSEGIPSEGGYYLDGEAIVEKAIHTFGYEPKDIWLSGFCGGAAITTHLAAKYHHLGINLFIQNAFDSMVNLLCNQAFPASHIAQYGIDGIKSGDPEIEARVTEDGYDTEGKLKNLTTVNGYALIVNTDTDRVVAPSSHKNLVAAAEKVMIKTCPIFFNHPDKTKDGHRYDVLSDRETWKKAVAFITEKDFPKSKRFWS